MKHGRFRGNRDVYCGVSRRAKIRYRTLTDAKKARSAALLRRPHQPLRIYRCPECSGYHLTHWTEGNNLDPRTVWKNPDRTVSSENNPDELKEQQDD